jgi:uncharacterized protein
MKLLNLIILLLIFQITGYQCARKYDPRILVVTGGHAYDTSEFAEMFNSYDCFEFEIVEKPEAWRILMSGEEYDAMIFYDMWQDISEEHKQVFLNEFKKGTGMVFLHHSLCSHQEWPEYQQLVGGKYYVPANTLDSSRVSGYRHDINLHIEIIDPDHPVTKGIEDFSIRDEGYYNTSQLPVTYSLLQTDHPDCSPVVGWAHEVKNAKVVYLMGGHDIHAYQNKSYRKLLANAINWTANIH